MADINNKLRGTTQSTFRIGISGPQLKNNSGVIEARDSTDAGFAIMRGATPVGNDDLTHKSYVDTQVGTANYRIYDSLFIKDVNEPYVKTGSATYVTVGYFMFPGTSVYTPSQWTIVGSRNGTTGVAYYRLYDATNTNTIAEVSKTTDVVEIVQDSSLTNLPSGQAIFEVQINRTTGSECRLHYHALT